MSFLPRCLYKRCTSYGGVRLKKVSVTWRCPSQAKVSLICRCPSQQGVCHTEVSVSTRCLSYGGVRLNRRCLSYVRVHLNKVSVIPKCPSQQGICHMEVSVSNNVSVIWSCPSQQGVCHMEVCILTRCLSYGGVHLNKVSVIPRCPSQQGVCHMEVSTSTMCLSYRGVHLNKVSVKTKCRLNEVSVKDFTVYNKELMIKCFNTDSIDCILNYSLGSSERPRRTLAGDFLQPSSQGRHIHGRAFCNSTVGGVVQRIHKVVHYIVCEFWKKRTARHMILEH